MLDSEDHLIAQCQAGNMHQFASVYDEYAPKVYSYFYYRTLHKETAEDLTSQTFFKTLRNLHMYSSKRGTFSTWLYSIARNILKDYYRSNHNTLGLDTVSEISSPRRVDKDAATTSQLDCVRVYLSSLPPEQCEIVVMRIWEQLSFEEISQQTGKSVASCKMRFTRTIKQLRKDLAYVVVSIAGLILLITSRWL